MPIRKYTTPQKIEGILTQDEEGPIVLTKEGIKRLEEIRSKPRTKLPEPAPFENDPGLD